MKIVLHLEVDEEELSISKEELYKLSKDERESLLTVAINDMIKDIDDWSQVWEFNEESWKKWTCWVLDEEEIQMTAEKYEFDFDKFTEDEIEQIAEKFRDLLHTSEADWWEEWIKESIKEVIGDNRGIKVKLTDFKAEMGKQIKENEKL